MRSEIEYQIFLQNTMFSQLINTNSNRKNLHENRLNWLDVAEEFLGSKGMTDSCIFGFEFDKISSKYNSVRTA